MRIYIFTDPFLSWSHTFIYDEIAQLERLDNKIRIISLIKKAHCWHRPVSRHIVRNIQTRDINYFSRYDIFRTCSFFPPRNAYYSVRYLAGNFIDNNFRYFGIDTLRGLIEKEKPDLFFVHFGALGETFLWLKEEFKIPYVVFFHGCEYGREQRKKHNDFKELFRLADHFLVKSRHSFEEIIKLGCDSEKVAIIPFGINPDNYEFEYEKKVKSASRIKLLGVGNLVEFKDFRLALNVIDNCRKRYPHLQYDIIGDGPLFEELSNKIESLGLRNVCFLHGAKSTKTISKYMRDADIYLQPVRYADGRTEIFPNSLLEAQLHGLPIVSTNIGGVPETVIHNETGFLAPEGDADALADYVLKLIRDEKMRKDMGENGKKNVLTNFNSKQRAVELNKILTSYLKKD